MHVMKKSLLLVGPGKYFGKETLKLFKSSGYSIAFLVSSEDSVATIGIACPYEVVDLTKSDSVREGVRKLAAEVGSFTCVIYNAKSSPKGNILEISQETFEKALSVNVGGTLTVIQESIPHMKEGVFIFTGGGYKDNPDTGKVALSVGKAALHSLFSASKEVLEEKGLAASTVIINGPVRNNSEIPPDRVAEVFLSIAEGRKTGEVEID